MKSERQNLVELVSGSTHLEAELPAFVFSGEVQRFVACDILYALAGEFAAVLNRLSAQYGDAICALVARRPSPTTYETWGTAGALRIELPVTDGELWEALNHEPGGDIGVSMVNTLESWAIVGESRNWAIWCDRSYELAIVATESELSLSGLGIPFQGVVNQVQEMLRLGGGVLPDGEVESFELFYGTSP